MKQSIFRSAQRQNFQGFTIVELVVVVAIIAVLAATMFVSYSSAQAKARDSKRMADLNETGKLVQRFLIENSGTFPKISSNGEDGPCHFPYDSTVVSKTAEAGCLEGDSSNSGLVNKGYISVLPKDPRADLANNNYYRYQVVGNSAAYLGDNLEADTAGMPGTIHDAVASCETSKAYCLKITP